MARYSLLIPILAVVAIWSSACGGTEPEHEVVEQNESADGGGISLPDGGDPGAEFSLPTDAGDGKCTGLKCQQVTCADGTTTTVSGVVYDPAARVPLYNVIVYVPNAPLDPIPKPLSCDRCGAIPSGSPIVTALTDAKGRFVLKNVPVGKDIPLVMQIGKWRRRITVPQVTACTDNPLADKNLTRLPKNRTEGDIPQFAVATGMLDQLECFLREIGIDDSEFVSGSGSGAVHLYQGYGGAGVPGATQAQFFWKTFDNLRKYDVIMLSCEGAEWAIMKPAEATAALREYLNNGGRVFASHYQHYWFKDGPAEFPSIATWNNDGSDEPPGGTYAVDMTFPKGKMFGEWLLNVGASSALGAVPLKQVMNHVRSVNPETTQRWVHRVGAGESVKYLSFATPVGKPVTAQCGRAVLSDIHISAALGGGVFPEKCATTDFTPQEKALEFLLFDLSACIQPDGETPVAPPIK